MAYETLKNKLAVRCQRKEQITSINKSMNNLNKAVSGLLARRKSLDTKPEREQQIATLSQRIEELYKMVSELAKKKGIKVDDGMNEWDNVLDEELAKYGYSQEKPRTLSFSGQEEMHAVPAKEMTGDSSYDQYVNLGKEIARKYNPHYKI